MGAYTSAIIATVATVATTATSFAVMAEEDQKKRLAERAASELMEKASKKLDVNYYEQLNIEKEAYEVGRRNLLAQGVTATEALKEGDPRALAAGVGRVQLAQQAGQEKISLAQQQEQSQLDKLVAGEESRLRDLQTQLDLQGAIGAQQASADAERASQMALQQGMAGVVAVGGQVAGMVDLYQKTPDARAFNQSNRKLQREGKGDLIGAVEKGLIDPKSLPQYTAEQQKIFDVAKTKDFSSLSRDAQQAIIQGYGAGTINNMSNLLRGKGPTGGVKFNRPVQMQTNIDMFMGSMINPFSNLYTPFASPKEQSLLQQPGLQYKSYDEEDWIYGEGSY